MKRTWNHTTDNNTGHSITVDQSGLEWVKYALPVTQFSGGGSQMYPLDEINSNNRIYREIIEVFGEKIAESICVYVREMRILNVPEDQALPENLSFSNDAKDKTSFLKETPTIELTETKINPREWNEIQPEYLLRFGLIAFENTSGSFQLTEKQSGIALTQMNGRKIAVLPYPFEHLLVVANPFELKYIIGQSYPKTIIEPLKNSGLAKMKLQLFPPFEKKEHIFLPITVNTNDYWLIELNKKGEITGKARIELA